jgi:hypothetical protein
MLTDGLAVIRPKQALFSDYNPVVSSHRRRVFLPSRLLCGVGPLPQLEFLQRYKYSAPQNDVEAARENLVIGQA